ncbi:hypothetical protein BKA93DRAFT_829603 [Sparassis latifolia]
MSLACSTIGDTAWAPTCLQQTSPSIVCATQTGPSMRASTAIPTIWDTLHIATTSFELPVSSDVLYLVSHGSLSFASGSVQITDEGSAGSDVADVEITAFFDHEHEFALTRVCALTACGGGERCRYIRGTIKFDSRSRLSCPPHPSPLFINKFETHLPWFAHHVGDLKDSVYFGRVSLRSAFIGYDVSSLFGEHIDVTTTLSAIKGSFNPSSYLTLHTSNAPISVQVGMLNDPEGNHTVVEIHTSNGYVLFTHLFPIPTFHTIINAPPVQPNKSEHGPPLRGVLRHGRELLRRRPHVQQSCNGRLPARRSRLSAAPVALTSNSPARAVLHPTFEGAFALASSFPFTPAVDRNTDVVDLAGRGRGRQRIL